MDDFQGLLARDFGLRPQGKAAPMSAARAAAPSGSAWTNTRSAAAGAPSAPSYEDLFGAAASAPPPKPTPSPSPLDSIFDSFKEPSVAPPPKAKHSSMPMFDKPVYDEDIFDGVPGVKSSFDDVFGGNQAPAPAYDDLLGGFGAKGEARESPEEKSKPERAVGSSGFDDLIPGFGDRNPMRPRETVAAKEKKIPMPTSKRASMASDPFVVLETTSTSADASSGVFMDPLDELAKHSRPQLKNQGNVSVDGGLFEDSTTFNQIPKSEPLFTSKVNDDPKDSNGSTKARDSSPVQSFPKRNSVQQPSVENFENIFPKSQSARYTDVHVDISAPGSEKNTLNGVDDQSPRSDEFEDDIWLTVSEIPLFTPPTSAPPPSRAPPELAVKQKPHGSKAKGMDDDYRRQSSQNYNHHRSSFKQPGGSSMDELEDFAMGKPQKSPYDNADPFNEEEFERSSSAAASAAAMKEAMDKAEAKFKHAKEVRERERDAKLRNREQEQDDESRSYAQDREERERQERLERQREMKQREEKEREQRRLQEEKELEQQRERERARQAVERATKEARERAAAEARAKAEREARQRVERAAVQRAQQEARGRAAVDARERAERAATESKERASAEAKEKAATQTRDRATAERAAVERAQQEARKRAERAAVERAAAEVRERQAAEAREKQAAAAAAAREKQSKPDDLESFFGMDARATSAPKQRAPTVDPMFDSQAQSRGAATSASASMRKASSAANFTDDLSAIFGGAPTSSDEFQGIEGESEERRRARLERHQRTRERAAKALAEKNERDMNVQRDQAERDRIGETLDFEIKRWSAGKEGNLRALLSTLQYVLWPECGWQPVSLTDLITAAAVKKVYRKATLCIHPDKVQQKGANLQQKYIAEKVFDLLKEAWNKFNSEELF